MKKIIGCIFVAATLAGCGGGPSKGEIQSAFLTDLQKIDPNAKIEDLDVGKCEKRNDAPGYACAVSMTTTVSYPMVGAPISNSTSATVVMDKIGGEWKVVGQL